jgi:hypothetical protein
MRCGLAVGEELAWEPAEAAGQIQALAVVRESGEALATAQQHRMLKAVEIRAQLPCVSTGAQCRASVAIRGDGAESGRAEPRGKGQYGPPLA